MLPHDGSPGLVTEVLMQLAQDLVGLSDDMRAPADAREWVISEYTSTLDRVRQVFSHRTDADFDHLIRDIQKRSTEVLAHGRTQHDPDAAPRDLFMIYVPEDRLPVAAPIAIELTKRRFTVAFSDFEVETADAMAERHATGARVHRAGILLLTPQFLRRGWQAPAPSDRFRLVSPLNFQAAVDQLASWLANNV
jgi:hypothetical protein